MAKNLISFQPDDKVSFIIMLQCSNCNSNTAQVSKNDFKCNFATRIRMSEMFYILLLCAILRNNKNIQNVNLLINSFSSLEVPNLHYAGYKMIK